MTKPKTFTDDEIRALIVQHYGHKGGCRDLARDLGVSMSTASALRRGQGALAKPAALFGCVSAGAGTWVQDASASVSKAGNKRWTEQRLDYVRDQLLIGRATQAIARDLGVPLARMKAVIKEHRLDDQSLRTPEERRYAEAERKARERGGSLAEMTSYMQSLLSTPAQRADLAKVLEMAKAREEAEAKAAEEEDA